MTDSTDASADAHAPRHESETGSATTQNDSTGDQRVSTLIGDRLCIQCGYNLSGQPVIRESHYAMLIVRCPECGTVASLQEHPLLGRWAARWAIVLVGLWLALLVITWLISGGILSAFAHELGQNASAPFSRHLAEAQYEWAKAEGLLDDEQNIWRWQYVISARGHATIDRNWWNAIDVREMLAQAGGIRGAADWSLGWDLRVPAFFMIVIGAVWSLLLPQIRRRWLPLWSLGIVAPACLFIWLAADADPRAGMFYNTTTQVAFAHVGWRVSVVMVLLAIIPLAIGLLVGRSIARGLVRLLLPPRLRGVLAGLWRIDGLDPPPGARGIRSPG